jgi:flavin-dependent dehydrogenase
VAASSRPLPAPPSASGVWPAIVVGAGPAGASAALDLARLDHRVLLVDRAPFPREVACGGCLNGRAIEALSGRGVDVHALGGRPTHRFVLAVSDRRARFETGSGAALSRGVLDAALVERATAAGAVFVDGTAARVGDVRDGARAVTLRRGGHTFEARARVVLAADGLGGRCLDDLDGFAPVVDEAGRMGAATLLPASDAAWEPGTIWMACSRHGYVGLVRVECDRLNVAAALDPRWVRATGGPQAAMTALLEEAGVRPPPALATAAVRGKGVLRRRRPRVAGRRLFVIGDAAAYVEPFTGEGIAWALDAAGAVAPIVSRAIESWDDARAANWSRTFRALAARNHRWCRLIGCALRRPRLLRVAAGVLAARPALARSVVAGLDRQRLAGGMTA